MTEFEQQVLEKLDKIAQVPENIIQLNENMIEEMRQRFHEFKGYDESVLHMNESFSKLITELQKLTLILRVYSQNIEVLNKMTNRMKSIINNMYEGKDILQGLNEQ